MDKFIAFGSKVEDKVTGFQGIVTCRIEHMHRCIRYGVQPEAEKGKVPPKPVYIDGPDLKVIAPPRPDLRPPIKTPNLFKLGVKAKDTLSGVTGILVARIKHPYAGDRYVLQPPVDEKNEIPEVESFDQNDLEQIDPPPPKRKKTSKKEEPPQGPHNRSSAIGR